MQVEVGLSGGITCLSRIGFFESGHHARRGECGGEWWSGPLWSPAVPVCYIHPSSRQQDRATRATIREALADMPGACQQGPLHPSQPPSPLRITRLPTFPQAQVDAHLRRSPAYTYFIHPDRLMLTISQKAEVKKHLPLWPNLNSIFTVSSLQSHPPLLYSYHGTSSESPKYSSMQMYS